MTSRLLPFILIVAFTSAAALGQRPPRPEGQPGPGGPPRGDMAPGRPDGPPDGGWIKPIDTNENGMLETDEFQAAAERTFAEFDRNKNGTVEPEEVRVAPPPPGHRPGRDGKRMLPPFFFMDALDEGPLSKADFDRLTRSTFDRMDKDRNGVVAANEARGPGHHGGPPHGRPGMAPNARFIAAELRFGDKLIKAQPFSAETVIEDTRRLFDGSTVTMQRRGAIYRDGEGRTRREQPLEMIGGVSVVGANDRPPVLVFINDFVSRSQIFLDLNDQVARKGPLGDIADRPEPKDPADAKTESLGTKTIEGIKADGTRVTFEIPAGQIGNGKPIEVVTERWFSPELQVLVMSRHVDPIAGEHVFRLINIKRAEPAPDLFTVPKGFRTEIMGRGDR